MNLKKRYLAGLILFVLCFTVKQFVTYNRSYETWPIAPDWMGSCLKRQAQLQFEDWAEKTRIIRRDIQVSQQTLGELNSVIMGEKPSSQDHFKTREKYDEVKQRMNVLTSIQGKLQFKWKIMDFAVETVIFSGIFIAFWLLTRQLIRMSSTFAENDMAEGRLPYAVFVTLFSVVDILTLSYTSIMVSEKQWIGVSSFFVSWPAWSLEQISLVALNISLAIPVTQLWCYTGTRYIPEMSDVERHTTKNKFDDYLSFMKFWTILSFAVLSLVTVILFKWSMSHQEKFEKVYISFGFLAWVVLFSLIIRMIYNAVLIRKAYYNLLAHRFPLWKELKENAVFPDPTISFIGEHWWRLPASFTAILTSVWAIFEFTRVSRIILDAIR